MVQASLLNLQRDIRALASPERAQHAVRFFRTGKGEYGEGDVFCGVTVPEIRRVIRGHRELSLRDLLHVLHSPIHEERLAAILILVYQYTHAIEGEKDRIAQLYLRSIRKYVNNWDLVDTSAPYIIGEYVYRRRDDELLETLAQSASLWERRVAIVATLYMIRKGESQDIIRIAKIVLHDKHDLIHKATGWMLREMGKNGNEQVLHAFLIQHAHEMPRTMLRYAIERFSKTQQAYYRNM